MEVKRWFKLPAGGAQPEGAMKLSRRKLIQRAGLTAGLGVTALLAACSKSEEPEGRGPAVLTSRTEVSWRAQTNWQLGTVGNDAFIRFVKVVGELSGGRFKIEPFAEAGIVHSFKMFDAVQQGELDGMHVPPYYWADKLPVTVFLSSFPLGPDQESQWEWFFGAGGGSDIAREAYASQGLRWVGPIQQGPNLIHSKVPLRTFEDFAGKKIRYPGGMVTEVFTAAGVSTIRLAGGEIYPALKQGKIDAADYGGAAINWSLGLGEVTKYIILPSLHQPVDLFDFTVNMEAWDALPKDLQKILIAAVKWHSWDLWSAIHEADKVAYRKFEEAGTKIITLPPAEVVKFRELAIPLWYKWAKKDPLSTRAFKIWLTYMLDTGIVERKWLEGQSI